MSKTNLAPILGTDKNNSCFTVFKSHSNPNHLEVYFGMALLEVVNNDKSSVLFKLLVGRLYNSRVKVKDLEVAFKIPSSTFRKWGYILQNKSDDEIIEALSATSGNGKITPEIDRFARASFQDIYPQNSYSYSKEIRRKIESAFHVSLSGESLRSIFKEELEYFKTKQPVSNNDSKLPTLKTVDNEVEDEKAFDHVTICEETFHTKVDNPLDVANTNQSKSGTFTIDKPDTNTSIVSSDNTAVVCELCDTESALENTEACCSQSPTQASEIESNEVSTCDSVNGSASKQLDTRNLTLPFRNLANNECQFYHHAGLLIFLTSILEFSQSVKEKIVLQWLAAVLLGAKNIGQMISLDLGSFSDFLDQNIIESERHQRTCLKKITTPDTIQSLLEANINHCGISEPYIAYYDPHSMPYTGMKNILKGWAGGLGTITKVNYHDFIHNFKGEPVWFECFDNYTDLRERFVGVMSNFAKACNLIPKQIATIVDRGIYGKTCMEEIHLSGFGLVTWQKNYKDRFWDDSMKAERFSITRCRNNSRDLKHWSIEYYRDDSWDTIKGYYRIIVKILAPGKKKLVILSILSNGKCSDYLAVFGMLNRWIQENDFGYLIRHFGINMITTYGSELYSEIEDELIEKEVYTSVHTAIKKIITSTEGKIKTLLLRRENKEFNGQKLVKKDREDLEALKKQLIAKQEELKGANSKEDKHHKLSEKDTERLMLAPKVLLDTVKISARNIFYHHVKPFRKLLDNYRVDHKIFRELTRAPGCVSKNNGVVTVELDLPRNFENKERLIIVDYLKSISLQDSNFLVIFKLK